MVVAAIPVAKFVAVSTIGIIGGAVAITQQDRIKDFFGESTPLSVDSTIEEQSVYTNAETVAENREELIERVKSDYGLDPAADPLKCNQGYNFFSETESEIAAAKAAGKDRVEAENAAREALNEQTSNAIWNNIRIRWNPGLSSLSESILKSVNGNGKLYPGGSGGAWTSFSNSNSSLSQDKIQPVAKDGSGNIYLWAVNISDLSMPSYYNLKSLKDDLDDDPYVIEYANGSGEVVNPFVDAQQSSIPTRQPIKAAHSDYNTITVADPQLFAQLIKRSTTIRNSIDSNLQTTVDNMFSRLDSGQLNEESIISPKDIVGNFEGDLDSEGGIAATLLARGYSNPSEYDLKVTVDHPDLPEATKGILFLNWDGQQAIESGIEIPAADYEFAELAYEDTSSEDGGYKTKMLSGGSPLQIIEVHGGESQDVTLDEVLSGTSSTTIKIPANEIELSTLQEATVIVEDGNSTDIFVEGSRFGEATNDFGESVYSAAIDNSRIDGSIQNVSVQTKGLRYTDRQTDYVANPDDPTKTIERVNRNRNQWEEIQQQLDTGGWLLGGGGGIGGSSNILLLGGAAVAAYLLGK